MELWPISKPFVNLAPGIFIILKISVHPEIDRIISFLGRVELDYQITSQLKGSDPQFTELAKLLLNNACIDILTYNFASSSCMINSYMKSPCN